MIMSIITLSEFKSRSPTCSEDSGKHSAGSIQEHLNLTSYLATVQLRRRAGEPLGIVLASGKRNDVFVFAYES